ncbi:winged helix-turn-helix domain-containing protein [Candidatus Enterococcus ferrettii]|uniref:OmpR/PhoB-type domain-containing protein n=1 Tax=Candidatus Enterococcus ferrettii TaxID=2815324 RepID=A0ABV0EMZ9_9ENTE|nr:helix-turn-helix domain-containing protein [Enterococcus sp. 665A]MBO1339034.1 winged helix-turn-helix domain-containing protein [Enterococcus sp. 665A]
MQHVLILTKNTMTEETIISKLQRMDCEILCSTDMLWRLQKGSITPFISYFQWVILSESLCHSEVEQLLSLLKNYPLMVLRIVENDPNEEDQAYWREQGIAEWLTKDTSYESLREKMNELNNQLEQKTAFGNQILSFPSQSEHIEQNDLKRLLKSFSKTERKVFECLIEAYPKSGVLSRKELCDHLWRDGDTPSNMSQLSCLINKLKRKFEQQGITVETITTLWGRGYRFSDEFYKFWQQESHQLEDLFYATN